MPSTGGVISSRLVERTIHVASSPSEAWRAIVDPEIAPGWMGMRVVCDWVVGGAVTLADSPLGPKYEERGTLLAYEPPRLLRYDHWSKLWRTPDGPGRRAVVSFEVEPDGAGARVRFRHELPEGVEALAEHSDFFWRVGLGQLEALLNRG